jgi:DNA polymerase-3 subunit delta'
MWNNVIGQSRIKKILRSSLEHAKLPSAYLFLGPEGTGKDAAALELAKAVNCLDESNLGLEACDVCANCIGIDNFSSPILTFLHARPKPSESVGNPGPKEEDIEAIREQLALKAADHYHNLEIPRATEIQVGQIRELRISMSRSMGIGKKRVVIMSEADTMNQQAQNAFLKTLEEPHANTMLILTSSNPHRFYPTVLSRCQDVRFDILSRTEIAEALVDRDELDATQAEFLSRLSAGSYSQARSMISEDIIEMRKEIIKFLRSALSRSRKTALAEISIFLPKAAGGSFIEKRVAVEQRLLLLTLWLRDALALATNAATFIINNDQREDLDKFVLNFGNPSKIIRAIGAVEKAQGLTRMQLQLRPVMIGLVMDLEAALR